MRNAMHGDDNYHIQKLKFGAQEFRMYRGLISVIEMLLLYGF